jgi:gamma-glutamyl hercynylcysteine S-oxide synthase
LAELIQAIHDPVRIRSAGADLLSLALMDARNHLLAWLNAFEPHAKALAERVEADVDPPTWLAGHAAWQQEWLIARNLMRPRGEVALEASIRLPSLLLQADALFDRQVQPRADRWKVALPEPQRLRQYLADSLDITLDLLSSAGPSDDELFVYRRALQHEDRLCEAMAVCAQTLQLELPDAPWQGRAMHVQREALHFGAQRFLQGTSGQGWQSWNERGGLLEAVPEFEIDAQAVSWGRFVEFSLDGGYDDATHWSPEGWAWVQAQGRRAPRHVEQMRESVLIHRQGRLQRVPAAQPVMHVSRHEAQAWCRWAGRRLPTELEWELAASKGGHRGFVWGDVFEWAAGSARPYAVGDGTERWPAVGAQGALKGASWMTRRRWHHPAARRFAAPTRDEFFAGFRSCTL